MNYSKELCGQTRYERRVRFFLWLYHSPHNAPAEIEMDKYRECYFGRDFRPYRSCMEMGNALKHHSLWRFH